MSLFDFIRLLYRNALILMTIPFILAGSVFMFTMNQDREYEANALIYTGIASGFNIESGSEDKLDYKAVNNAFDNLILVIQSRFTLEEVSLRLLAKHLMVEGPTPGVIGAKAFKAIDEFISPEIREMVVDTTEEMTYQRLDALYHAGNRDLETLLNKGTSPWSIKKLESISTVRVKSSDMVQLSYITTDPAISQQTLTILLEVFTRRYKDIKQSETGDVVAYFIRQLSTTKGDLNDAEDRLTSFRVKSRVINYVEQTKAVAFKKQNALEEYSMKKINLKATEAALNQIEEKLKIRESILGKNVEILEKKQRLSTIAGQLALVQTNTNDSTTNTSVSNLLAEQKRIKEDLKKDIEMLFNISNSKEGLPSKQLLNDWLNTLVQYEREKVTVKLYQQRLDDLDAEYDRFAPMGSTIARLEREISVYEREYLEVLHGLNMAKLRQQNIEMSNSIEVLDEPRLPIEPLSSKRMLLVIATFMFGFFAGVASLIAKALLDNTLQHPARAEAVTKLEIAGALPAIVKDFHIKYGNLREEVIGIMTSKVKLEKYTVNKNEATVIVGISTQRNQGKRYAFKMIFDEMVKSGENVCLVSPRSQNEQEEALEHHYTYEVDEHFVSNKWLIEQYRNKYKYVLLVLPEWVSGKIPVHFIENAQVILWTIRADNVWSLAHKNMLKDLEKINPIKPALILNGVKPYYLDQVVVEIPVNRSALAKWMRKILRFELGKSDIPTN